MGFLKKLTVAFALAAGSHGFAVPANAADSLNIPKPPAKSSAGGQNHLPLVDLLPDFPSKKGEEKDLQAQYCTEFRQPMSDEYTRYLTHSCFLDFNDKMLQSFNPHELFRKKPALNNAGIFINIDEAKIGPKWDLTPVLGLGFRF